MKYVFKTIILLLSLIIIGCNPNRLYNERIEIPNMIWHQDSLLNFNINVEDANLAYDIKISIRSNVYFQSRNLWLFINTTSPSGLTQRDTIECMLSDEKGNILGDASGDIIDYEIPFKNNIKFSTKGIYKFSIQHGMRMEKLPCVDEIGIILDKKTEDN
ncbi:MAG: gliding motility lipoprotein GldH [Bacteroidales bacterium]|nr:gliding motility lipoprotein GldH [Bacteroidales bacterium]